ncbi:uncharacterized protein LOC115950077 [Quercus lobata]|uniref:uncharacterized protein LOC115950077 n=1 Tax=Quercus lobata TaxID=97700 RepID=UPI001246A69B|nr:uncharacterized protein LOC115950077 [Quercus lobata]
MRSFSKKANSWNRTHFGNLFQKKKRILARLKGIQESLAVCPNDHLINLEKMLRSDFAEVAKLEEEFWAMKSRILWLIEGDRNTSFYHTAALVRRRRNCILCMKDRMGNWINGDREISEFIREGFDALFTSGLTSSSLTKWNPPFGDSVKKEIHHIFTTKAAPEYLNKTLITLIPKSRNPETLNNYRPISLCNTVYKMVTKIIVAQFRPLLPDLISPLQSAFVPGRQGMDNAIIVQELIHSMVRKKGRVGVMAIKLDLEKAYDRLEWSFIRDTPNLYKFPNQLVSLIMSCVSSSSISILVNGSALEPFYHSRGIRQGDPLSPYLFILCMEVLEALLEEKCKAKLWNSIKASQGNPEFSHVFFADDLMLFTKADRKNCTAIRDVLDFFCELSEQKISTKKSRVYFSPNVDPEKRTELGKILGFRSTPTLGKYLGFPIKHSGLQRNLLDETLARTAEVAYLVSNGSKNTSRNKIQVRLCIALKLPAMEIELDAKVVIDLVRKDSCDLNSLGALVADCKEGLKEIPYVKVLHCFREANKCADNLTRRGAMLEQDFIVFIHPPTKVELLIDLDVVGTMYDRFVSSALEVV